MSSDEQERIARLEREVAILRAEFARLRERVGDGDGSRAGPARDRAQPAPGAGGQPDHPPRRAGDQRTPPPAGARSPRPASSPHPGGPFGGFLPEGLSMERVIGRYGTVIGAALMGLIAVGLFLRWSIEQGYLTPEVRVAFGGLTALIVGYVGMRLRLRGAREFGNIVLAIALGIVHLVSWSAGPLLHVVPSWVALAISFVASALLTEFALRHDEEALCAIGFGGCAIAPFVTSDGSGNVVALATYGVIVIGLSAAALGGRPWRYARRVTIGMFVLYLLAVTAGAPAVPPWPMLADRLGVLFPALVLAVTIPLAHAAHRRTLVRAIGAGLAAGGLLRALDKATDPVSLVLSIVGSALVVVTLDATRPGALERERDSEVDPLVTRRRAMVDGVLLPVALFIGTLCAAPDPVDPQAGLVAVLWTVGAVVMTHRTRAEPEGEFFAISGGFTALWIVPGFAWDHPVGRALLSLPMAAVLMIAAQRARRLAFAWSAVAVSTLAFIWAMDSLGDRPRYEYMPFMTVPSLLAALAAGGWALLHHMLPYALSRSDGTGNQRKVLTAAIVGGLIATAFFWGMQELEYAFSRTAGTALLILYFAFAGALLIWLGRSRGVKPLRLIGLGLCLLAAWNALVEAFALPNVAVQIAVFGGVGLFLIGVGYWYRRGGDDDDPAPAVPASPGDD